MATFTTTAKHALRWLTGANLVSDIDLGFQALAEDVDGKMAIVDSGSVGSLPTSSPGTPGKLGRLYRATDTGQLFFDYGTGWIDIPARQTPVAAFPTSNLYDGLEVLLLTSAMIAAGVPASRFRYRQAASTLKWEEQGAAPWFQSWAGTSAGFASTSYGQIGAISTAVQITVPWVGQWLARWGYKFPTPSSGTPTQQTLVVPSFSGDARSQADKDRDATSSIWIAGGESSTRDGQTGQCLIQTVTANTNVQMQQRNPGSIAWTLQDPWLELTPRRVDG